MLLCSYVLMSITSHGIYSMPCGVLSHAKAQSFAKHLRVKFLFAMRRGGRRHNMTSLRVLEVSLDEEKCFCQNHKYIVCCFCTYSAPCGVGATQGVAPSSLALGWGLLPFQGVMMVLGWWRFYRYLHAKFRKESVWFLLV